jgi:hypothetical protein
MTAAAAYRLRLALAIAVAVTATGLAVALAGPVSLPLRSWPAPVPLTAVSEARAVRAASADPVDLDAVERFSRDTLAARPGEAAAWARLAWVASERRDVAAMHEALERSYTVAPYGPDITAWRLRFAYGQWAALTPELRRLATEELMVSARYRHQMTAEAFAEVSDPAGRLAFDLTVRSVQAASRG